MIDSVMVVEDEVLTARYITSILNGWGIRVIGVFDNAMAVIAAFEEEIPGMVLMDVNIRGKVDGFALSDMIWEQHTVPIVYITAYCDNETLQKAFRPLAYGYVMKPFGPEELETVLRSAYRRHQSERLEEDEAEKSERIVLSPIHTYDLVTASLYADGEDVALTAKQNILLEHLVRHRHQVVSYHDLEFAIWADEEVSSSSLKTVVYSLRKRAPELRIKSLSKQGYILS
ncbi:DNA-binding response regulator [Sulfurimonas sp. HSL1-6]|uniref:DNA-binding response regulator n=1 Tax=Thiomicrolovo immobilis TaxID=3131935 RepID=UPI0031F985D0